MGGGRYDGLVGQFGVEPVPTIGFAAGDVVFADYLRTYKLVPNLDQKTSVVVLVRDNDALGGAQLVAKELREAGLNVSIDISGRKFDKQYKTAVKTGVKKAVYVGSEELSQQKYVLKDLASGKEQIHSLERIVKVLK